MCRQKKSVLQYWLFCFLSTENLKIGHRFNHPRQFVGKALSVKVLPLINTNFHGKCTLIREYSWQNFLYNVYPQSLSQDINLPLDHIFQAIKSLSRRFKSINSTEINRQYLRRVSLATNVSAYKRASSLHPADEKSV